MPDTVFTHTQSHCLAMCNVYKFQMSIEKNASKKKNSRLEKRLNGFVQQWLTHRCGYFHIDTEWTTLVF